MEAPHLGKEDGAMPHERIPGKASTRRYTPAEKEQAVRLVRKLRSELGTEHGTIRRVAGQLGYGVESVRAWVRQADIDDGEKPGTTSADAEKIRRLEQENRELKRANDILRRASAFFAAELDRPQK
jgi:transposase